MKQKAARHKRKRVLNNTHVASFSSTYCIAHRPSILPIANPLASVKQLTTRVCHFRGLCIDL